MVFIAVKECHTQPGSAGIARIPLQHFCGGGGGDKKHLAFSGIRYRAGTDTVVETLLLYMEYSIDVRLVVNTKKNTVTSSLDNKLYCMCL